MINLLKDSILNSQAEALVCPVNTTGEMVGLASQFRLKFPDASNQYMALCRNKQLLIGHLATITNKNKDGSNPKYIIFFPVQFGTDDPPMMKYIAMGMLSLIQVIDSLKIQSISIPPLGGKWGNDKDYVIDCLRNYSLTVNLHDS